MRNIERPRDRVIFWLFLGVQLPVPLASITLFQRRFDYSRWVIFYHVLVVVLGAATALGAVRWPRERRVARYVLPLG